MTTGKRNAKTNQRPRIVIIGGGYAGIISALRLARQSDAEIHLINPQPRFIERIRLHEAASGRDLPQINIPQLLRGTGITFHQTLATHIDWQARAVTLQDDTLNSGAPLTYDRLIYAVGSQTDRTTPGVREYALSLEGIDGAAQMASQLAALPAQSEVVVVGNGLTGTELVFELTERYPHLRWTMVAREPHDRAYAHGYTPTAREYFLQGLARRGVTLRAGIDVQRVERDHLVTNAGELPFALCLWAGSFRAAPLGRASGLAANERDQLLVDETLRSLTAPEVYVAGDSAALPAAYQPYMVMGCKTAMPQGVQVADNLLAELRGDAPQPLRFAYMITCVSLGRHDGLVQMLTPNGEPTAKFLQGGLAAWIKEFICRFTVWTLRLERRFNFYDWFLPSPAKPRDAAQLAQVAQGR